MSTNQFEYRARAAKVERLLAVVPVPETYAEVAPIALFVERMTVAQRHELARQAGVLPPSERTWGALVRSCWHRGAAVAS